MLASHRERVRPGGPALFTHGTRLLCRRCPGGPSPGSADCFAGSGPGPHGADASGRCLSSRSRVRTGGSSRTHAASSASRAGRPWRVGSPSKCLGYGVVLVDGECAGGVASGRRVPRTRPHPPGGRPDRGPTGSYGDGMRRAVSVRAFRSEQLRTTKRVRRPRVPGDADLRTRGALSRGNSGWRMRPHSWANAASRFCASTRRRPSGGLYQLRAIQPHQLHLMEVYSSGRMIRVYTEGVHGPGGPGAAESRPGGVRLLGAASLERLHHQPAVGFATRLDAETGPQEHRDQQHDRPTSTRAPGRWPGRAGTRSPGRTR